MDWLLPLLLVVLKSVAVIVVLLIIVAYLLWADRKIWAAVQLRRGPNVVGPWGLLQSFADLLKFVVKEPVIPAGANKGIFLLAPFITGMLALRGLAALKALRPKGSRFATEQTQSPLGHWWHRHILQQLQDMGWWFLRPLGGFPATAVYAQT